MIRLAGFFLLIISCMGIGFWKERQEQRRIQQLEEMRRCMDYLKGEIFFARTTLPEAMEHLSTRVGGPFDSFFFRLSEELKKYPGNSFSDILRKELMDNSRNFELTVEDREAFYQACCNLGYLDKEMQIHILERYLHDLDQLLENLKKELPQRKKLYRSLGILSGVFLAILFL